MSNKQFVIVTACDLMCGDFLVNHWLKSLIINIDRNLVDIVVLDYGLSEEQREVLIRNKVKVVISNRDGLVCTIRFRDLYNFLKKNKNYKQVLSCDSGDLIFQKDITHLFYKDQDSFRAFAEELPTHFLKYVSLSKSLYPEYEKEIFNMLRNKAMINSGFFLSPANKIEELYSNMEKFVKNKDFFGTDQIIFAYTLYKNGFVKLENVYNFALTVVRDKFKIKDGVFYTTNGEIISVVHNVGWQPFFRPIQNFGYGKGHNKLKFFRYLSYRIFYKTLLIIKMKNRNFI